MPTILLICTANICRSPVAAAILQDRLHKKGVHSWVVRSAGTWAETKRGASRYSIRVMAEQGFDLNNHISHMLEEKDLQEADLVLCMESGHVEALQVEFPTYTQKVFLLSEMIGKRYNINDPYGQDLDTYRHMANEVSQIIDAGLDNIVSLAEQQASKEITNPQ